MSAAGGEVRKLGLIIAFDNAMKQKKATTTTRLCDAIITFTEGSKMEID